MYTRLPQRLALAVALGITVLAASGLRAATTPGLIEWQDWRADLFEQAARENRFVLLDLEAVWCHWCHVMDRETYANPEVAALVRSRYIAVRVDQDANPDLANRYGDWGWPATIVFAPDGTEIVKRRGFMSPVHMLSMLQAIIDDPSPGPSVQAPAQIEVAVDGALTDALRAQLRADYWRVYDPENGGWGNVHKFLDGHSIEYALAMARKGERMNELMARQTLGQSLNLLDPEWGGIFQYSNQADWRSPHYEKLTTMQARALRLYALAHQLFGSEHDVRYLDAARSVQRYLLERLRAPSGAFYVSQDADVDDAVDGRQFYSLHAQARDKLGRAPRVDTQLYARDNGQVATALLALYDATGDSGTLEAARRALDWALAERRRPDGGFDHGQSDRGGPFLGANVAMAQALVALHASTGERRWLTGAMQTLDFVDARLRARRAGYLSHPVDPKAIGVFADELLVVEENVELARAANLVRHYSGEARFGEMAIRAMRYLGSPTLIENRFFLHGVLLANHELTHEPVHMAVVGAKNDPAAQALHAAARRFGAVYRRLEWWDRAEGPLPNPDIQYPRLDRPAAFACTEGTCSLPVFEPDAVAAAVERLLQPAR